MLCFAATCKYVILFWIIQDIVLTQNRTHNHTRENKWPQR